MTYTDTQLQQLSDRVEREIAAAKTDPKCIARAKAIANHKCRKIKHWQSGCVAYWSRTVDEVDIGSDWDEAHFRCWRCGTDGRIQKCHIIAKQLGGSDHCSNIVPLCAECHDEAPDVVDNSEIWRWIRETRPAHYGKMRWHQAIKLCLDRGVDLSRFNRDTFFSLMDGCVGLHLMQAGTGCRVKASSIAWAIEKSCGGTD